MDVHVHVSLCRVVVTQIVTRPVDHPLRMDANQDPLTACPTRLSFAEPPAARLASAGWPSSSSEARLCLPHRAGPQPARCCLRAIVGVGGVLIACAQRARCVLVVSATVPMLYLNFCRGSASAPEATGSPVESRDVHDVSSAAEDDMRIADLVANPSQLLPESIAEHPPGRCHGHPARRVLQDHARSATVRPSAPMPAHGTPVFQLIVVDLDG